MRATVMYGAGDVRVESVPDARIVEPTDAVVRVTRACEGHVGAGGIDKDVRVVDVDDDEVNDAVDAAKYRDQPAAYVDPMVTPKVRAATIRLDPRS